jgi:hypothetical protein
MAARRKLTAALATPVPEVDEQLVRSFVTQNRSTDSGNSRPPTADAGANSVEESEMKSGNIARGLSEVSEKRSRLRPVGLIPITVRLRPELAGGLRRASLERELQGADSYTQQDLVEQVLEPWLREEGYLS